MLLAKYKEVQGTHGVYTYNELVNSTPPVVESLTLVEDLGKKGMKEEKAKKTKEESHTHTTPNDSLTLASEERYFHIII